MSSNNDYIPPKVWKWEEPRAGEEWRYSGINRPIAGPTHDAELPVGKHHAQRRESDRDAGRAARTTIIDSQVHAYQANTPKRPWHSVPPHVTGDEMVAAMDKVDDPGRFGIVKPVDPDDPVVADAVA